MDPYLASQALCTVFPTPVIQLLVPPISQIREIRQFKAQTPSPLGAPSLVPQGEAFTSSLVFLYNLAYITIKPALTVS